MICGLPGDMPAALYSHSPSTTWDNVRPYPLSLAHAHLLVLAIAVVLALGCRVTALSTYGLSEDEINKVRAIEQYRAGHFSANAEHPMLMKLAMWGSVDLARAWNRIAPSAQAISLETAIRLPNAVAGTAITVVLFGIADLLFGRTVAAVASLAWAFDVNAIAINRIGKEDTFLLLFFLLAVLCYERAKRRGFDDPGAAQRWYSFSGASFGLMAASKYMPHYFGLYALYNVLTDPAPGRNRPNKWQYYAWMAAAFLAGNVAIVMPETWRYAATYVQGRMLAHHGYPYAGGLYLTNIPISPLGVPPTYYLRLLATKVPLVLLAALIPGAIEMVRRHRERGFVLLRVLVVFVLVPYSLMAAKFIRYTLPLLAVLDLIAAIGIVAGTSWLLRKSWLSPVTRVTVSALAISVFAAGLAGAQQSAAPFYSLFQNAIGARLGAPGSIFPEETYDYGVREAVAAISAAAAPSAVIVSDAGGGVAYYLARSGRPDIAARGLSTAGLPAAARETWVIVQNEHTTFENRFVVEQLRAREKPWAQFHAGRALAVQVFRIHGR
jgi:Dolichyl-phosphate-mannose-protein mannosyltransferase